MAPDEMDEHELERALSAPGTAAELADQEKYVAMFRAAQPAAAPTVVVPMARRTARRVGTTAILAAAVAVATGGVAAAYSSNLPAPVQRAVHSVLAPLGVPQADPPKEAPPAEPEAEPTPVVPSPTPVAPPHPRPTHSRPARPSSTPSPTPTVDPSASPTDEPTSSESPSADPSTSESASPSATPTTSPTAEPTPTAPPAPVPASVAISSAGAGQQVAPGGTAIVTGTVAAADGAPVPGARVVLRTRSSVQGWTQVAVARSGADGSVSLSTGAIQRSSQVRLTSQGVRSANVTLVVQPSLTAYTETTGDTATVTASAAGGQSGDQVVLLTRRNGQLVQEATGRLDGSGRATLSVAAPLADRNYVVRLVGTQDHAEATAQVRVKAAAGPV
ncbi:hypothetical protein ASC77_04280 [Nocardioides sp. Root1257]|uniref:hypothetical protein n=1 Tax=unclassified Nocardioides TaxID=2615069 RepID=UPI0006F1E461|nr:MULTISPECIES: hypothetical protein [unclassified Nocardioides]KQW53505.1 hypothetical protein ASC77_04280 [Nocardioides sp. Root1257]KRC56191.1 hypothetical protein ASE24_04280 [Nocardioides sp. Root224]